MDLFKIILHVCFFIYNYIFFMQIFILQRIDLDFRSMHYIKFDIIIIIIIIDTWRTCSVASRPRQRPLIERVYNERRLSALLRPVTASAGSDSAHCERLLCNY